MRPLFSATLLCLRSSKVVAKLSTTSDYAGYHPPRFATSSNRLGTPQGLRKAASITQRRFKYLPQVCHDRAAFSVFWVNRAGRRKRSSAVSGPDQKSAAATGSCVLAETPDAAVSDTAAVPRTSNKDRVSPPELSLLREFFLLFGSMGPAATALRGGRETT